MWWKNKKVMIGIILLVLIILGIVIWLIAKWGLICMWIIEGLFVNLVMFAYEEFIKNLMKYN
jgi:type IV secretory pathway TrbD component